MDGRIRILFITKIPPVDFSTSDAYFALPEWLSGHCELILASPPPADGKRIEFENNLAGFVGLKPGFWNLPASARKLSRLAVSERIDVIMTGVDEISLLAGIYASAQKGCPLIAVCEDHPFWSRYYDSRSILRKGEGVIRTKILRFLLRRPNKILCFIEKEVLNFLKISSDRLIQLRNGVHDSILSLGDKDDQVVPFSLGYIGAVEEFKGSLDMLAVLARVRQRCPDASLTLVGSCVSEKHRWAFERRCLELGLDGAVRITGYRPHGEALRLLRSCAVCLHAYQPLPWLYYNQALKVAEYMAIGKAVVSWNYPGARRLLNGGRAGVLVEPGNLEQMAESVTTLLMEEGDRRQLEKCAKETAADRLVWSQIGQEALEAIQQVS
jgi:glycosyltransferase involved in cell wall biosynthesis